MKSTWTIIEKTQGELVVEFEMDEWKQAQKKALAKLSKDLLVPGFRKGKAPVDLVKKQLSTQSILVEAVENMAQKALEFGLDEHKVSPISQPELGLTTLTEEEAVIKFTFEVLGEVKLGQYKGLNVEKALATVSPEEVDSKIEALRERFAELVLKETGSIQMKDTAIIDFEGFKDGVAFEGGKGENYALEIGSNSFIPGFEEALIGMDVGQEGDIPLTFPETYQAEHLAGQEVVFKVKINEIKEKQLPELNEQFIQDAKQDVASIEELRAKFEKEILEDKQQKAIEAFDNEILTKVVENAELDVPDVLVDDETKMMLEDFKRRLQQQGFTLEMYNSITGQSEEDLKTAMRVDATSKVKVRLVLDAIAKEEKIEVSHDEIHVEYRAIAQQYNMSEEEVERLASHATIEYDLRLRKALELIREANKSA
jgi:trigger factor